MCEYVTQRIFNFFLWNHPRKIVDSIQWNAKTNDDIASKNFRQNLIACSPIGTGTQ